MRKEGVAQLITQKRMVHIQVIDMRQMAKSLVGGGCARLAIIIVLRHMSEIMDMQVAWVAPSIHTARPSAPPCGSIWILNESLQASI